MKRPAAAPRVRLRTKQKPPPAFRGGRAEVVEVESSPSPRRAAVEAKPPKGRGQTCAKARAGPDRRASAKDGARSGAIVGLPEGPRAAGAPWPATPADPRLEPPGAALHAGGSEEGRLVDSVYKVFVPWFERESAAESHPHPHLPGLGADEVKMDGLKVWNDSGKERGGAGWIAVSPVVKPGQNHHEEKWFNIDTWKSWRLAFVLARLQRKVWEVNLTFKPADLNEDKLVEIDGELVTPDALRRMAHQVAQSLRPHSPSSAGLGVLSDYGAAGSPEAS